MADLVAVSPDFRVREEHRSERFFSVPDRWWMFLSAFLFLVFAVCGPMLVSSPTTQHLTLRLMPPSLDSANFDVLLGTDSLGRNQLARVAIGARTSLFVGVFATACAALIGLVLGLASGLSSGWIDALVTGLTEIVMSVPTIVIGIVLVATLGQGFGVLFALLVLTGWIGVSRVTRLQVKSLRQQEFVLAARASGASEVQIATRHLWPNVLPVALALVVPQVGTVMVWEASLSYLGIGLPSSTISLGGLVRDGQEHVFDAWWLGVMPGLVLVWAVTSLILVTAWMQQQERSRI